jgi:thiamine kinase-like enzyme
MSEVLRTAEEATPERLTAILRRHRTLPQCEVLTVRQRKNPAFNSVVTHLELSYTHSAPATAPNALVLKANLSAEWAKEAGRVEVAFYRMIAALPDRPSIVVPCYDAQYDPETGDSHLLLLDVSSTHHAPLTRDQQLTPGSNVPDDAEADAVVEALARFHACWWNHPMLGSFPCAIAHWFRDEQGFQQFQERRRVAFRELMMAEESWFPAEYARTYEAILAGLPHLWERYWRPRTVGKRGLTLTHGDAYFSNFLCPNLGTGGGVLLLDWQSPEGYLGASDLANLLATFLNSAQRKEGGREDRLLRLYHTTLKQAGVQDYSWQALLLDYRLTILDWLLVPLQDRHDGSRRDYWWPKMQYLMEGFRDWRCAELLPAAYRI